MSGKAVYPELVHSLADDRIRELEAAAVARRGREERHARRAALVRRILAGPRGNRSRPGRGPATPPAARPATAGHEDRER